MKILNRPAAVSSTKVFEQHSNPLFFIGMGRAFKDGVSQKTCQDLLVLTLSGNKAEQQKDILADFICY